MSSISQLEYKLNQAFNPEQSKLLAETITAAYDDLVLRTANKSDYPCPKT